MLVRKIEFCELVLFHCGVSTRQNTGAISTLNGAPVDVRAFLVEFNSCFYVLMMVKHNPQCNNACVLKKIEYGFHVLAIVWSSDGEHALNVDVCILVLHTTR